MDPLANILMGSRVRTANFTRLDASAPWGLNSPGERGVNFVLLVRGSAILTTPDSPHPISMRSGDVFIKLGYAVFSDHIHTPELLRAHSKRLFAWIVEGKLKVHIGGEYSLAEAARAHAEMASRSTVGKLLLQMA